MFAAARREHSRAGGASAHAHAPAGDDTPETITVLLVEDDFLVAAEAEAALTEAGFRVAGPANSAAEAVALALQHRPDLVVMDIRLAGARDGIDAAREIHETLGTRSLFATAHSTPEVRARAEGTRPLGWLPKPYSPEALVEAVNAAVAALKA